MASTTAGGDSVLSTGATPLLLAAKVGDNDAVRLLLKYHPLLDLPNADGVTPLMAAAGMGHGFNPTRGRYKTDDQAVEGVKLLQAAGAKVTGAARDGLTALHSAATHGWDDTVKVLVADGAPLQAPDRLGLRPIDYAAGRQPRAFLEPEHVPNDSTVKLLTQYIVAATGQPPVVFAGNLNRSTQGTGGAAGGPPRGGPGARPHRRTGGCSGGSDSRTACNASHTCGRSEGGSCGQRLTLTQASPGGRSKPIAGTVRKSSKSSASDRSRNNFTASVKRPAVVDFSADFLAHPLHLFSDDAIEQVGRRHGAALQADPVVDPLPHLGTADFGRRRIFHEVVQRHGTLAAQPRLNVLHAHANVFAQA